MVVSDASSSKATASASLRNSLTTAANASGCTPASHKLTRMDSVSRSKPVFKMLEISNRSVRRQRQRAKRAFIGLCSKLEKITNEKE